MMRDSIGDYLKTERETRRLSIEEVSSTTRIPRRTLESLEDDRFEDLPSIDLLLVGRPVRAAPYPFQEHFAHGPGNRRQVVGFDGRDEVEIKHRTNLR